MTAGACLTTAFFKESNAAFGIFIFLQNVEAWQPATGSAPPLQVEVCRHPSTSTRGG
jgi:hypothetical protein